MIFFGPKLSSKNPKINAPIPAEIFKTIAKLTTSLKLKSSVVTVYIPPKPKIVIKASL